MPINCLCYNTVMDNKAYLDEIAVKGKKKFSAGPILTPVMIKLIAAAAVAVVAMIVVGGILASKNGEVAEVHQMVYARIESLLDDEGPLNSYSERLKSSDLRTYTVQLLSSLESSRSAIETSGQNVTASGKVTDENSGLMMTYMNELEDGMLSGQLDKVYATDTAYHLSLLISLEQQARAKATNDVYANALDASIRDLQTLQKNFKEYSDTH